MEQRSIFTPLKKDERKAVVESYLEHLCRRDGVPNQNERKFSVREEFFRWLESCPVRRSGPPVIDPIVFEENESRRDPAPGLNEATLWALAMAKSNRAERDAVEYAFA